MRAVITSRLVPDARSETVTLLFTDIEGSTRLWDADAEQMAGALVRHDGIVRGAIERAGGLVFKTVGDGHCAAFAEASAAVKAAVAAQRALLAESWPEGTTISARMAMHTGECIRRDGDFFGPPVNRVARLVAVGHGGQVLLSGATRELVVERLGDDVSLRHLGEHRLKDLGRPEQIYQVCVADLPAAFDPLVTLDDPELRHNLPLQTSSFVGRNNELTELLELFRSAPSSLMTLTGSGGVGKTRLALQVAAEMSDVVADGVWLAELAPLSDPALVDGTVAALLGVREQPGRSVLDNLVDAIGSRHLLIILDNCEHVLGAASRLAAVVLRGCRRVKLLATSREPLGVNGERVYRLDPMRVPRTDVSGSEAFAAYDAVQLFVERAAAQRRDFKLDEANSADVVELCRRLDGIPLAIELAAARLRSLSVADINKRLEQRFKLLTGGARQAAPRQQTLRALIDWSYDLLTLPERSVLERLSVFAGGFTLEAAEAVVSGDDVPEFDVLELVASLVDKSVVQAEEGDGKTRFRLLETVRDYAADRLATRGDAVIDAVRRAHREHFLTFAEAAAIGLSGPEQFEWLERLETDHDNLRAALAYSLTCGDADDHGLRLAISLFRFWHSSGRLREGAEAIQALLLAYDSEPSGVRARALANAANLLLECDPHHVQACAQQALHEARLVGDASAEASALSWLVFMQHRMAVQPTDAARAEEALERASETDDPFVMAWALAAHAADAGRRGDLRGAQESLAEAISIARATGDQVLVAPFLINLSVVDVAIGHASAARSHLSEAMSIAQRLKNPWLYSYIANNRGWAAIVAGDLVEGREKFIDALTNARRLGQSHSTAAAFIGLAVVAALTDEERRAATLFGAADQFVQRAGLSGLDAYESFMREHHVRRLRRSLGDGAYDEAHRDGRSLAEGDAIALALDEPGTRTDASLAVDDASRPAPSGVSLSAREQEIIAILAQGATDAQIAARLYLSVNTVQSHLDRIRNKTGLRRRAELARLAE